MVFDNSSASDKDQLKSFLNNLREVLSEIATSPSFYVSSHFHASLREVWPEIEERFQEIVNDIDENWEELEEEFENRGLTKRNLKFKLEGFRDAVRKWWEDKAKKRLLSVLGWADVILGSLVNVLPKAELIKEFKEALEQGVEDKED